MTSITIHKDDYDADSTPKNDDGEEFALVMVGQDQIVFSDGYGALNAALFDDEYADLDPEGQLEKRHDLAVILATSVQGNVVSNLLEKEALATETLTEPEINLIFNSKDLPWESEGEWNAKDTLGEVIPLVIVATMYAPFTEIARVAGADVLYIDPTTEENFVTSLSALGIVDLLKLA